MEALLVENYKGYVIKIYQDEDAMNPRKEMDNAATMVCRHRRYNLGDLQIHCAGWQYIREVILNESPSDELSDEETMDRFLKNYYMLPLFLFDHSGISISTGSFSDPWDSGQVGFIYISKEKAIKEFGNLPEVALRAHAIALMESEVKVYDDYLRGDVCGYEISQEDREEEVGDSCWGFYGSDYCMEEARRVVDWEVNKKTEDTAAYLVSTLDCNPRSMPGGFAE